MVESELTTPIAKGQAMNHVEAFDLVEAGQGRWEVQHHGILLIAGQVSTNDGFTLMDRLDRPIGIFDSVEDALRFLLRSLRWDVS